MTRSRVTLFALYILVVTPVYAKVSPEEAERLHKDLTPTGAERAGNADGTIPPYSGEILGAPKWVNYPGTGVHYPNPYTDDQVLFKITANNYRQHLDKLSPGTIQLFERYPRSFWMPIYRSRRDVRYDDFTLNNIFLNALNASLANGGNGVVNGFGGPTFPIPQSAEEVIWNHLTHPIWWSWQGTFAMAAIYDDGKRAVQRYQDFARFPYFDRTGDRDKFENLGAYFIRLTVDPPRQKGELILVHEYLDQVKDPRAAWVYMPGNRRVRRAPTVGYDNPSGAGGLRTDDDRQGYNGAIDRYDWHLIGKKELYIPYNNYAFDDPKIAYEQLLPKFHVPPELMRYELHRVWYVEATLKEHARHIYSKRHFYLDEDSWGIALADCYDGQGDLWRTVQVLSLNAYDLPGITSRAELEYDFHAKAYTADKLYNEEPKTIQVLNEPFPIKFFTPSNLRKLGIR